MAETKLVSGPAQPGGFSVPGTPQIVDATFQAAHVVLKPDEYQFGGRIMGHYRVAAPTGLVTGASAGALLFSLRYADATSYAVLKRISVGAVVTTAFTAAQAIDFDAIVARGWSASDTGGTALVLTANSQKARTSMGSSLVGVSGDARVATTAGLTAGGTKTLDANAFAIGSLNNGNALGNGGMVPDFYRVDASGQHPIVLAANEGVNVRIVTAQGAVGVVKYYVCVEWVEVAAM